MPHDADTANWVQRKSWVASANETGNGFPLTSLPFCAFIGIDHVARLGVGIGDFVLDLRAAAEAGLVANSDKVLGQACTAEQLNELMECDPQQQTALRAEVKELLGEYADSEVRDSCSTLLRLANELQFALPVRVTDYTDFYASREHALNVGKLFRPNQPLLPNYDWVPIGYHGRASSVVISGTDVRRPYGQQLPHGASSPVFEPSRQQDYEAELAAYIGSANDLGQPVPVAQAGANIFGFSLLNDWSARDIQAWEYQPLGPFLGKSFATSVSPWVVPSAALEPYRVLPRPRAEDDPKPLPYLEESPNALSALDITVEALLVTQSMREAGETAFRLSLSNARGLYWSFAQMLAHHTSNGCNLRVGNIVASGTISQDAVGSEGCLLERTKRGANPVQLPNGESRSFLEDGDEVILRGFCEREGLPRISFGECRGVVLPAH